MRRAAARTEALVEALMSVRGAPRRREHWRPDSAHTLLLWNPHRFERGPSADREVSCFELVLTTQF